MAVFIAVATVLISAIIVLIIIRIVRAHKHQPTTGREELIGKRAIVKVALKPEGTVFLKGEHWTAISETGAVKANEEVIVTGTDGLRLKVARKA
ncbi:NfeD family protein [Bacteroidota bacterium]